MNIIMASIIAVFITLFFIRTGVILLLNSEYHCRTSACLGAMSFPVFAFKMWLFMRKPNANGLSMDDYKPIMSDAWSNIKWQWKSNCPYQSRAKQD